MLPNYTQKYNRSQSQGANPYHDQQQDSSVVRQLLQQVFSGQTQAPQPSKWSTAPGAAPQPPAGGGAAPGLGIQPQTPQQPPPVKSPPSTLPSSAVVPGSPIDPNTQYNTDQTPRPNLRGMIGGMSDRPWLPGSFGASSAYSPQSQATPPGLSSGGMFTSQQSPMARTATTPGQGYNPGTPMPGAGGAAGDLTLTNPPGSLYPDPFNPPPTDVNIPGGERDPNYTPTSDIFGNPLEPAGATMEKPVGPGTLPGSGGNGTGGGSFAGGSPEWFGGFNLSQQYGSDSAKGTFLGLASAAGVDPTAFSKEQSEAWFRQYIMPGMNSAGFEVLDVKGDKAFIRTAENPEGTWIDFVSNAGGGNAQYAWQDQRDTVGTGSTAQSWDGNTSSTRTSLPGGETGTGTRAAGTGDEQANRLSGYNTATDFIGQTPIPDYAQQIMAWLFGEGRNLYNK